MNLDQQCIVKHVAKEGAVVSRTTAPGSGVSSSALG
jgi:hypothetical protein